MNGVLVVSAMGSEFSLSCVFFLEFSLPLLDLLAALAVRSVLFLLVLKLAASTPLLLRDFLLAEPARVLDDLDVGRSVR